MDGPGAFDELISTSPFAANADDEREDDDNREFTAEKLANWNTFTIDDEEEERKVLQSRKTTASVDLLEKRFQFEHRQRLYYFMWWIVCIGYNIPLHYFLWGTKNTSDRFVVVSANLLLTLLLRNEHVVWAFYIIGSRIAYCLPAHGCLHWMKSFVNKMTVNIGGIHTASSFFLIFDWCWVVGSSIKDGVGTAPGAEPEVRDMYHFFTLVVVLVILWTVIIMAIPLWRHLQVHHDLFEFSHRFGGWTVAGMVLIDVLISLVHGGDNVYPINAASTWMIIAAVWVVIWPWLTFRPYVTATVFAPSDMVCIVTWKGKPWYFSAGTAGKIAVHPLGQYHSFALLPHIGGDKKLSVMAIAKAGDWTKALIDKALIDQHGKTKDGKNEIEENTTTTKVALYRYARPGFMYLVWTYKRVICIGTGAGIAPISAYLPEPPNEMLILWFGRKFEQTYGPLFHFVAGFRNSILIDTKAAPSEKNPFLPVYEVNFTEKSQRRIVRKRRTTIRFGEKRPDIPKLTAAAVEMFKADAVFIVSGPKPSYDLCHAMWKVGIHAYSATWDS